MISDDGIRNVIFLSRSLLKIIPMTFPVLSTTGPPPDPRSAPGRITIGGSVFPPKNSLPYTLDGT